MFATLEKRLIESEQCFFELGFYYTIKWNWFLHCFCCIPFQLQFRWASWIIY